MANYEANTTRSTLASLSRLRSYEGSQVRVKRKGKSSKRALLKLVRADSSCDVEFRDGSSEKRVDFERITLPSQKSDESGDDYSTSSSSEEERSTFSRGDLILCKLSEESTRWQRAQITKVRSHGRHRISQVAEVFNTSLFFVTLRLQK